MQPKRKLLTPSEKKALSYQKDRRNTYGERGANSRFAIRKSKALIRQALRSAENQALRQMPHADADETAIDQAENTLRALPQRKRRFYKSPDSPLGLVVNNKLERRHRMGINAKLDVSTSRAKDPLNRNS